MLRILFVILIHVLLFSCNENKISQEANPTDTAAIESGSIPTHFVRHIQKDTTILISNVPVDILIPSLYKADLLLLPGWNFSRKAPFGTAAINKIFLDSGYRLIIPEMGKSVYATNYFPETRSDWRKYPTLKWVTDTMIPVLQIEYGILHEEGKNYIAGISTGARGTVLIAARKPAFVAGAALSGDYDQTKMKNDNLMKGVYGEYAQFKERWESIDNPMTQAGSIHLPLYLGHGEKDRVVSAYQTFNYYHHLDTVQQGLELKLNITKGAGHDTIYWLTEMKAVMHFFDETGM